MIRMKKQFKRIQLVGYILLVCTLLTSCNNKSNYAPSTTDLEYKIIEIDKCEYIIITYHEFADYAGYGFLAHKGNCKYCQQRANKTSK